MSDFDITSINSNSSFVASLKKRKAFGLLDSDSEDDDEQPAKKPQKKKPAITTRSSDSSLSSNDSGDIEEVFNPSSTLDKPTTPHVSEEVSVPAAPQPNPYLMNGPDLDLIRSLAQVPTPPQHTEKPAEESPAVIDIDDEDEAYEIENLDPELEALLHSGSSRAANEPEKITVKLQYNIHTYPTLSENAKKVVDKLIKPMKIIIMNNTQFDKILDVFCAHKTLSKAELVLVYNNDTVFLTGTPAGLGMTSLTPNLVQVYPRNSYELLVEEREQQKQERYKKWAESNKEDDDLFDSADLQETENPAEDTSKFLIRLRAKDNQEVRLRVKSESTIGSVIAKYKELQGISGRVDLSFEGEVLDPDSTIGDADMEDEDLVEVTISN